MTLRSRLPARSTTVPSSAARSRCACPTGSRGCPTTTSEAPSAVHRTVLATPSGSATTRGAAAGSSRSRTWTGARGTRSRSSPVCAGKARRRPSGDQAGCPACRSPAVTCRQVAPAPGSGRSTTCSCGCRRPSRPAPSGWWSSRSATTGAVSSGSPSGSTSALKASREPSGLHTGVPAPSGSRVSCCASPPRAGSSHSWAGPSCARRKAIQRPSGDQAGEVSDGPVVSGAASRVATSTAQSRSTTRSRSASAVRSTYATRVPSGESAGEVGTARRSRSSVRMRRVTTCSWWRG